MQCQLWRFFAGFLNHVIAIGFSYQANNKEHVKSILNTFDHANFIHFLIFATTPATKTLDYVFRQNIGLRSIFFQFEVFATTLHELYDECDCCAGQFFLQMAIERLFSWLYKVANVILIANQFYEFQPVIYKLTF